MPRSIVKDICGNRYGRLVVIGFIPDDSKYAKFMCACDCGNELIVLGQSLSRGATKSCGCLHKDVMRSRAKHGQGGTGKRSATYGSWASMMTRCEWRNSHHESFKTYGAVGIRVDPRWHDFEKFYEDMGDRPDGTSLDRIDNTSGYAPGNCRWASRLEQAINTSRTVRVVFEGEVTTALELCARLGISMAALRARAVRRGNDYTEAFRSFGIDAVAYKEKRQ